MKTEKVKIPTPNSKNIVAVIHYPQNDLSRLAIFCPGNLDSKDYDHLVKLSETFSEKGYTAVRFDPIGTGESDGADSDYLVSEYLNNVRSVIEYMLSLKPFGEILLGGHSRGAAVSIMYAAQDPRISKVVAIMPPSPISDEELKEKKYTEWKKNGFNLSVRDVPDSTLKREYRLPYTHLVDRMKFDVIGEVQKVHVPIIFIAGELDTETLPEDIKDIFNKANEPKKYILLDGIGHGYRRNSDQIEFVNNKIVEALDFI
ncbi:MAG: alpha/beta hydrolase [Patescibacteria group bacterium]